jgi:hypothetical protein
LNLNELELILSFIHLSLPSRYSQLAGHPDGDVSHVTDDQIVEVARQSNAHDFIMSFPEGYETVVGERGVR